MVAKTAASSETGPAQQGRHRNQNLWHGQTILGRIPPGTEGPSSFTKEILGTKPVCFRMRGHRKLIFGDSMAVSACLAEGGCCCNALDFGCNVFLHQAGAFKLCEPASRRCSSNATARHLRRPHSIAGSSL